MCIGKESFYLWKIWYPFLNRRNSFFGQSTGVCHLIWSRWKIIPKANSKTALIAVQMDSNFKNLRKFLYIKKREKKKEQLISPHWWIISSVLRKTEENGILFTKWKSIQQSSEKKRFVLYTYCYQELHVQPWLSQLSSLHLQLPSWQMSKS